MSGGRANPWELIGLLIVAGLVIEWFGDGVFMALVFVAFGIYVLVQLTPVFRGIGRGLVWLERQFSKPSREQPRRTPIYYEHPPPPPVPVAAAPPPAPAPVPSHPTLVAYRAMGRQDMAEIQRLVETQGVDPFAPFPAGLAPPGCTARSLYGCAKEAGNREAEDYFNAWRRRKFQTYLTGKGGFPAD